MKYVMLKSKHVDVSNVLSGYSVYFVPLEGEIGICTDTFSMDVAPCQTISPTALETYDVELELDGQETTDMFDRIRERVLASCKQDPMRVSRGTWQHGRLQNRKTDRVVRYTFDRSWQRHHLVIETPSEARRCVDITCWYLYNVNIRIEPTPGTVPIGGGGDDALQVVRANQAEEPTPDPTTSSPTPDACDVVRMPQ